MIGIVPTGERIGRLTDNVALYWDVDQHIGVAPQGEVFTGPETTIWSGASVIANEPFDHIWLWLTAAEPGTCRIAAEPAAIEAGVCRPAFPYRTPAIVEGDSLAYLAKPRSVGQEGDERRYELGATGHGPAGVTLAQRLCEQIHRWDRDRTAQPVRSWCRASDQDTRVAGVPLLPGSGRA